MYRVWLSRLFLTAVAATAAVGIVGGTACTRWGQPGPITPTLAPISSLYVSATTGSDATGNGSMSSPYKTLTKAVAVLVAAKSVGPNGVTIFLGSGDYDAANGETFPIVIPKSVSITGMNYGAGPSGGSFVNGYGEDTIFERIAHTAPHSVYTTLEVIPPASVSIGDAYVGASKVRLGGSRALYASVDVIGTLNGSTASFGAGIVSRANNLNGVLVASGTFICNSCQIRGNGFGIGALTVPLPTVSPSPSSGAPSIMLTHGNGDSTVGAKVADILTDGSANLNVSGETFTRQGFAYADTFAPIVPTTTRGAIDFGGGVQSSPGGNSFIGAKRTEIFVTRRNETVSALDDAWNPSEQQANRNGRYPHTIPFGSGASGRNVSIVRSAIGSTVTVGPAPAPTPTPSITPSVTPSPTPA
ncbi:MAG: DUF1565 domain-containing protein [Candidatus Eremiobacteraeota bacterium]|nr:DUF1565 domain-containing protein [Candidatus Eremiobacteraeota bacterium]MBV8498716.1 DUF1565 domain-containing protein [Candidatus Eremiobacteraeota bacterium]